jgi:hypothetical protein
MTIEINWWMLSPLLLTAWTLFAWYKTKHNDVLVLGLILMMFILSARFLP